VCWFYQVSYTSIKCQKFRQLLFHHLLKGPMVRFLCLASPPASVVRSLMLSCAMDCHQKTHTDHSGKSWFTQTAIRFCTSHTAVNLYDLLLNLMWFTCRLSFTLLSRNPWSMVDSDVACILGSEGIVFVLLSCLWYWWHNCCIWSKSMVIFTGEVRGRAPAKS